VNAGSDVFVDVWNVVFCGKKRMDVVDKKGTQTDKTDRRELP
jgi:hypothetical protein